MNQPDLTSERFITNPFGNCPSQRLYRTGDLASYLPDGNVQFLGRIDHQLKVGGYRIEAAEIESMLNEHPGIKESVVVAFEDTPGLTRLVAYFVPTSEKTLDVSELRIYLKSRLPAYMVPYTFMPLEQLPKTPNGKIDRQSLPYPVTGRTEKDKTLVAPRDQLELQLTLLWEKALGIQPIGISENFFDLGGHSLLAVRLFAQMEKVFGCELPLATLYEAPTVEQFAGILRHRNWSVPWTLLMPIRPGGNRTPFFLVHGTEALASGVGPDQPFYRLNPHGIDGRRAPESIEEMAADYNREIQALQPVGPYYLGGYSLGGLVAYEAAQQLRRQGHEVALLLLLDPVLPEDWQEASSQPASQEDENEVNSPMAHLQQRLKTLAALETNGKLKWFTAGLRWRLKSSVGVAERAGKLAICSLFLALSKRIPATMRGFYFSEAGGTAWERYIPKTYPGRIVLLQATNGVERDERIWRSLATGGLDVLELPGGHLDIIQGPEAQLWADQLATCLRTAQEEEATRKKAGGHLAMRSLQAKDPAQDRAKRTEPAPVGTVYGLCG